MKVIQIPFCFYPDPPGGTEIYVESLAAELQKQDIQVVIAAPAKQNAIYMHNNIPVRRFAISEKVRDLREFYGDGDPKAAFEFVKILDEEKPDLVHMHAFTYGVSLHLVREAKKRKIPVVFTYHTPTVSCQRGTLMRWGNEVCDGRLDLDICTSCTLHGLGLPRGIADIFGLAPRGIGRMLGLLKLSSGIWTALRMRELIDVRHTAVRAFIREVDDTIVLCKWCKDLLLCNNIPVEKISVSRHGVSCDLVSKKEEEKYVSIPDNPLKIAYFGRLNRVKGPDIVIRAIRLLSKKYDIEFHIYGIVQDSRGYAYLRTLKKLATGDRRIRFMPVVPNEQIVSVLKKYHLLAVPSRWLETGPLVVLEAFAAGIPVIGSKLGGIAELIENGVNGILIDSNSPTAWSRQLQKVWEDRGLLRQLYVGIREPRTMIQVAKEMMRLYESLINLYRTFR